MSSEQKPESWGYGLTWLVIIAIIGLIGFGAVKLRTSAKENYARLVKEKAAAEELAKAAAAKETEKVKEKQLLEDLGPQPTAEDIAAGKALYMTCAACHGPEGKGSPAGPALGSPNLAGMPLWYTESQITKIKNDYRKSPKVMAMKPMVMNMTEKQIFQVSGYIQSLAPAKPMHNLKGDLAKGKKIYEGCAACHKPDGSGNASRDFRAAPLNNLPDWYIVEQLKQFKSGTRGSHPKDAKGATMAAQALNLTDQDMLDVAEYIKTLQK